MSSSSIKVIQNPEKVKRKHSEVDGSPHKKYKAEVDVGPTPREDVKAMEEVESIIDSKERLLAEKLAQVESPKFGQIVNRRDFRRAGPYLIGQKLGHSPVDSIVQYLAKKENSNEFVQLKILMLNNNSLNEKVLQDERQGKMLLHTEFSLLSLLNNQTGVIQQHGMFSDMAFEEDQNDSLNNDIYYTGKVRKRLVLVLDCVTAHNFDEKSSAFVNLQQYLINRKKLPEMEALKIFYEIILVVENLHKHNVIHRDLKLGNIVLNVHSNKIKIINFCLGKYLLNENDLLNDQRGSPAYISPDVLCGQPYKGKPSDMWALGVVLFMMLYRQFPFFESTPTALFKKIKSADYTVPLNSEISEKAEQLIKGLLQLSPDRRLTATQVRQKLDDLLKKNASQSSDRTVPEFYIDYTPSSSSVPIRKSSKARSAVKRVSYQLDQVVPVVSQSVLQTADPIAQKRDVPNTAPSNNMFTRTPPRITVERIGNDARHLSLSDLSQLLRPNQINPLNIRNIARNWQEALRLRTGSRSNSSQVTQQMSNLSLRSRRDTAARPSINESILALGTQSAPSQGATGRSSTNSSDSNMDHYSRYLSRLYRCALVRSTQNRHRQNVQTSSSHNRNTDLATASSPSASSTPRHLMTREQRQALAVYSRIQQRLNDSVQSLFESFNEMFVRGRIVSPNTNLLEFTGIITEDLADKLCDWLVREHRRHSLIQSIFLYSTYNSVEKVLQFLRQCGVQLQTNNRVIKIKRNQSLNLLMVLTYLLHAAGYNNTYFIPD